MTSSAPTSALVLDFICLFTHDLKRKQKRWQDGVLKYHTFNKRIMVYDDRSHFIGDAHWQEGGDLQPGDEFELDRGSAIVQVSDCTGQREQDLTELLDKRAKEVERRRTNAGVRTPGSSAAAAHTPRATDQSAHFQLRHRPLTDLVGGSSRIGRAVISPHSPYEARKMATNPGQQLESPSEDTRPAKRRKHEESPPSKMGHARSLFGTTLTLTPYTSSNPVARSQALRDRTNVAPNAASISARTGTSGLPDRAERGSKSPSPSEDLEKVVGDPIPRQPAPRRTLPQRASLRELLGGNERNPNLDRPRLKEANPQNHKISVQLSKPRPSLSTNAVASVPLADSGPSKDHNNSNLNRRQTNEPPRRKDPGQPSRPHLSLPKAARAPHPAQEAEQDKDEAFLSWLQSSEDNPANSKVPTHESIPRPSSPCDSARDDVPPDQEPIEIDEEEEPPPPPKATTKRAERTTVKPPTKTKPHKDPKTVGTKRALSSESALASRTEADDLPPPAKEPRTELRIRSRQRRGLLMISEKQDKGRPTKARVRSAINTVAELESTPETEARSVAASEEPRATDSRVIHRNLSGDAAQRRDSTSSHVSVSDSDDSSKEKPVTETPCLELNAEVLDHASDEVADHGDAVSVSSTPDDDIPTSPPRRRANPTRRSRRKPPQPVLSDDEDACMDVDSPTEPAPKRKPDPKPSTGPRITKMSRKSVKSREIIGFVVPTDDFPAAAFASMSTDQLNAAEVEKTGGAAEVTRKSHTEGAQHQSVAQPEAQRNVSDESQGRQPPPRLMNPATRGKKAARREDAAGQPPQTLIQLEPAVPSRIAPPAAPAAPVKRAPSGNDGAQSALPGFARANGGAWSRHAEDLLGMKRPSRTKPRR